MGRLLAEDLVLLCWDDGKGRARSRCTLGVTFGVGGALMIEALVAHALAVDEWRVRRTGGGADDALIGEVADQAEPQPGDEPPSVSGLVQTLSTPYFFASVRDRLISGGVLRQAQRRRFGLIPVTRFPAADPAAAAAPRHAVRPLLTGDAEPGEVTLRTVLLAALARPTNAVDQLVGRSQRGTAHRRAAALAETTGVAETVGTLSEAITMAIAATTAAASGAVTGLGGAGGGPGGG